MTSLWSACRVGRVASALIAALAGATLAIALMPAPAHAGSSPITVDYPNGVAVASGEDVVVTGFNASGSTEAIYVECTNSFRTPTVSVSPGSFSVSIGSFNGPDTCRIRDDSSYQLLATFTVDPPITTVSDASVSREVFYPLVRDRYQDTVRFNWRQDHRARAQIRIVNSDGRTVRTAEPSAWRGRNGWTWNGKKDNGNLVGTGRYRIKVKVNSNSVSARVAVKTEVVTRTFGKRKEGNEARSFATRGNCRAYRDSYYQTAVLDCWGGRYARGNYRIAIPSDAFDVRGKIDLLRNGLDICCQGRISKGWSRPSNTTVALWAQVTGWRATEVNFVKVVYKRRVRI